MTDWDEKAAIQAAKINPEAFGALYERYVDRIDSYVYHRVGNTHDAQDLTSRTFYRALSHLDTYQDKGFPFSAWLYRIAHNLVVDHFRSGRQDRQVELDDWSIVSDEHPAESAESLLAQERLRRAIGRLTEDQSIVITLKFIEGLSNAEVAGLIGKSEGAVKSLQFRGLAALRRIMGEDRP